VARDDIVFRLDTNFNPQERTLYVQLEDFPKIINTFCDHRQYTSELAEKINEYIKDNVNSFNYGVLSEIAVAYAQKTPKNFSEAFFATHKEKMLKDLQHLDQDNFYKIVWALIKAGQVREDENVSEWSYIKKGIQKKIKEFDSPTLTNLLVLTTLGKQ